MKYYSSIVVSPDVYEITIFRFTFDYLVSFSRKEVSSQVKKVRKPGYQAAGCGSRVGNGGGGRMKNTVIMVSNLNKSTVICRSVHIY